MLREMIENMADRTESRTGGRPATNGVIPGDFALSVGKPTREAPTGWNWTLLTDVARLESGHTPSRRHPEYWGGDVPWIGIKDATDNHGRTIYDTYQHTNQLGIENSSARILPTHTVCLSRTASVGYVIVMGKPMATSQDFVNWVCSDALDYRFLKYVLLAEKDSFLRFASGTTHQTIYYPEVKAFHICLPPKAEQKVIADILTSLDDKIELNRRMNATLEATARTIFQSWFVDYDPVHARARGEQPLGMDEEIAALFPDSFEDSELGMIPAGWRVVPLDQIADFRNGLALQKFPPEGDEYLPVIKIRELRQGYSDENSDKASPNIKETYILHDGDVVFSWSGSLMIDVWCGGKGALNQHLFKVTSVQYPKWFYLYWSKYHLDSFIDIAADKATTMGHIQRHHLTSALTVVPPDEVLSRLSRFVEPLVDQMIQLRIESRKLAELRDTLLPLLMNGELTL
ncbi:MAG: restriction endonuclease subunit S [Anaerolinea sp.]|nr:restriction endonuclease subunit S [Anaerolinea sp.]